MSIWPFVGERVALLGPNGAGKTTLVLHCNGVLTAGAGAVRVGGLPVEKRHLAEIRRRVGIVFQDPDDQLFMPTVRDDVAFGPTNFGVRGAELEARVDEALAAVGMDGFADRTPHHLSFGQRRRVAVATVLACHPQLLVLDEPSSNLDPASRRELADIVRSLDVTLLMVTHDLLYALELCPRAVVIDEGVIVADGSYGRDPLRPGADGSPPAGIPGWARRHAHRVGDAGGARELNPCKNRDLWRSPLERGAHGDVLDYDAACLRFRRAKVTNHTTAPTVSMTHPPTMDSSGRLNASATHPTMPSTVRPRGHRRSLRASVHAAALAIP